MSVNCYVCGTPLATPEVGRSSSTCGSCGTRSFLNAKGPAVLVAHASEALADQIGSVLTLAGMTPLIVRSGEQAFKLLEVTQLRGVVLDVALDEVMSFQIIERIKATPSLSHLKIVLVASVYNKAAYKRRPSSLYGADDYVEQHHIPDHLPERLCRLLGLPPPQVTDVEARRRVLASVDPRHDLTGKERVRALALSIVADIALYYQEDVIKVSKGEPAQHLPAALNEGRRLLAEMVDPRSYAGEDPILDAFRTFLTDFGVAAR